MKRVVVFFGALVFTWVNFSNITDASAQNIDTLIYCGISIIPFQSELKNETIEELSGIEYTGVDNFYYVIPQSRKKAHVFLASIEIANEEIKVELDSILYLDHGVLEAESIRINPTTNNLYIAEEGSGTSYIYKVEKSLKLQTVYTSTKEQRHNRGYEGLSFSTNGLLMFMALERPKEGNMTRIIAYNLKSKIEIEYSYALDELPLDTKKDNGISELLTINDTTLLVVERAFLGPKNGNSIRVYKAIIPTKGNKIKKVKLLTNFSASPHLDNIEGVSFSASGKELIFVSDNNGNPHQQTLFICMKIE